MIHNYNDYLNENIFVKNFEERINQIDEFLFELRDVMGKIEAIYGARLPGINPIPGGDIDKIFKNFLFGF
jgi:hypothetical protein